MEREAVSEVVLDIEDVWNPHWLRALFSVEKFNPEQKIVQLSKQRWWGVDFYMRNYCQLPAGNTGAEIWGAQTSDKAKIHIHSSLYRAECDANDSKRLRLRFFKAEHPYELLFQTAPERQRFYELSKTLRLFPVWCPALCPYRLRNAPHPFTMEINGSKEVTLAGSPIPGETHTLNGVAKIKVSPGPTEDVRIWVGTKDLKGVMPGKGDLQDWMPKSSADIYVTAFEDIPPDLQQSTLIGEMVSKHLGTDYVPLLSTELEGGKRSVAMTVVCHKQKALKISRTGAWTGNMQRTLQNKAANMTLKQKMGMSRGRADAVVNDMVALNFSVNETSFAFIATKLKVLGDDQGEMGVQVRNDILRELLSKLSIGPESAGDASQKFHHSFVLGGLGYGTEVANHNWQKLSLLPRGCDRLSREIAEGRCLYHFQEADLQFHHQLTEVNLEQRILYKAQSGETVTPVVDTYKTIFHKRTVVNPCTSCLFVAQTLLTYCSAFGTPSPIREFTVVESEFLLEKGRPGAWEVLGKPVPAKMFLLLYSEFAEESIIKVPLVAKAGAVAYTTASPIPMLRPSTHFKEYLAKQYLWASIVGERNEDVVCSGVILMGKILEHEQRATIPVVVRLKKGGIFADSKLTLILKVEKDMSPVNEGMIILSTREGAPRADIQQQEQIGWDAILALVGSEEDAVREKTLTRLARERQDIDSDEEDERVDIEEEEEGQYEGLYLIHSKLKNAGFLNLSEQRQHGTDESERRVLLEIDENAKRGALYTAMLQAEGAAAELGRLQIELAEEEDAARNVLSEEQDIAAAIIEAEIEEFKKSSIELFETVERQKTANLEDHERGLLAQNLKTGLAEIFEAQREELLAFYISQMQHINSTSEPNARSDIISEEESEFNTLYTDFTQGCEDISTKLHEIQRDKVESAESTARKAIETDALRSFQPIIAAAAEHKKDAEARLAKRLTGLQRYREEIITEEADHRVELYEEEVCEWRLLHMREVAERKEIRRNGLESSHRDRLAVLIRTEHEKGVLLVREEQLGWEDLMRAEHISRREHHLRKLKRDEKERHHGEVGEAQERRSITKKEDSRFMELLQAFSIERDAADKKEYGRLREEIDGRDFLVKEEFHLRHALANIERLARKDARRLTQTRRHREAEAVLTLELGEEHLRGDVERAEEKARRLIASDLRPTFQRQNVYATAVGSEVDRLLQQLPWEEDDARDAIRQAEDKAWCEGIEALKRGDWHDASESSVFNEVCQNSQKRQ